MIRTVVPGADPLGEQTLQLAQDLREHEQERENEQRQQQRRHDFLE